MTFSSSMIKHITAALILLTAGVATGYAQSSNISPYSRFGLGDLHDNTHTEQFSMGGLSIPVNDPFALNVANPATYHNLARPLFGVGMRMHLLNINTASDTEFNQNHSINNLAVAFPIIRKKWGLTVGVMPFSTTGYNISQQVESDDFSEPIRFEYIGEGGITRAFLGNSVGLYNREDTLGNTTSLSVGANISYLFGSVDRVRKSIYPDQSTAYNFRARDAFRVSDVSFELGTQFIMPLIKMKGDQPQNTKLIAGATFRMPKTLNSNGSLLAQTYSLNGTSNVETAVDTVSYIDYSNRSLTMPLSFGVGAAVDIVTKKFRKLLVGVEYRTEMWSEFADGEEGSGRLFDNLSDNHKIIVGLDYLPQTKLSRKIFSKIHYRMGVRYEKMNLSVGNEDINAYGISFGAGIPISLKRPQSPSTFNIGVELGQRGTTANNLVREDYLMISFGLTLMPHFRNGWFVQRKYD